MAADTTSDELKAAEQRLEKYRKYDPELVKIYDVEFLFTGAEKAAQGELIMEFKNNNIVYDSVELDGNDLIVIINMRINADVISCLEKFFKNFAENRSLVYEGWNAFR